MRIWRGRRCRVAEACLRAAGVVLVVMGVMLCVPGIATANEGNLVDSRDVGTPLDLKGLTHADAGASIVYTAETHAPFTDQAAAFQWGIDRDLDEAFDFIVFTEWRSGKLVGGVKDATGRQVASATVSRPGPTAITVSFPAELLGGAASYRYAVNADGDLAPNSGLVQHRLAAATSAPATPPAVAPPPAEAAAPAAVTAAPRRASGAAAAANLPKTGPGDRPLLPWAGTTLMLGGALVALGTQRNRLRRGVGTGGIR
jgi:LPXTG-motif cell wall-anchored protein